ncbi:hypothetical protein, partial [Anaplasma bovis]|uniref:hypothetical protein n=1 Tax=Anaplasma bovis TaxID=186733 RepID=UPI002FF0A75D
YTGEDGAVGGESDISLEQRVESYDSYTGEEGPSGLAQETVDRNVGHGVSEEEKHSDSDFGNELKKTSTDTDNASVDGRDDE